MTIDELEKIWTELNNLSDEFMGGVRAKYAEEAPKPEPETAFQGVVRKALAKEEGDIWLTKPWDELKTVFPKTFRHISTVFNATVDLVDSEVGQAFTCCGPCHQKIQALKEPTP